MTRILTELEYVNATREVRELQSLIVEKRLKMLRDVLHNMDTPRGRIREKRRAEVTAQQYERTIVVAERVELDELRNPFENAALGRQRLAEAMQELYPNKTGAAAHRPDATEPTPGIKHGLSAYRRKLCKCKVCRGANAEAARGYKQARKERENHNAEQHTSETTDARSATSDSSSRSAAA
ncbi:hypothetical protein SEA_TIMINATOR_41 [Arthrobacter phage Timinator]|uniref:Uncharacterized protein n=2 Tax=Marthavirus barretlemon TaxID=2560300 RepID=A0A386KMA0_9CAUD|nr:hypothetical protein SEA_TIMINATOR_41 [Arthrobacter phage Timinator]AYD86512.1 hypothetical protein SEA_LEEROYJ_41 [Arthrobacter phage LeeroyJ]